MFSGHNMDKKILWKSMGPETVWSLTFFKNSFVSHRRKKCTGLEECEGEQMTECSFLGGQCL